MSRTDKDKPHYAIAEWWKPDHYLCEYATLSKWRGEQCTRDCDLPPEPVRSSFVYWGQKRCRWEPVFPYPGESDYRHYGSPPPRWYRKHVWWGPERRHEREDSLRAIAEYRATGEVDVIHRTYQGRNCAYWYWA